MTYDQFVAKVIDTARAGQPPAAQVTLSKMESEIEALTEQGLHELATKVAGDARRRHLLQKAFSLTLPTSFETGW
jgi:hypothetical protein